MVMAIGATFACFFAFVIVGWLIGAGLASIVRSQVIAMAGVLFLAAAIAEGLYALIHVYDSDVRSVYDTDLRSWYPAIALIFVVIPGAIELVIGGIYGVTR